MKNPASKIVCVFSLLVVFLASSLALQPAALAQKGLTKLADNVYSYVDVKDSSYVRSFGANAGIIIGKEGIVVVDALLSAKEAQRFIKDIRTISKKPIRYVINTHYHLDHAFGNSEFAKQGGVIVAHKNSAESLQKNGELTLKSYKDYGIPKEALAGTRIVLPRLTYDSRMTINLGDQKVELIYFGASHTSGDTLVYLPDKKLIFTGDALFTNFHPFLAEGDLTSWAKVLDSVLALDVAKIVPGHGPLSTKKNVEEMKDYLTLFDAKAKDLATKSRDLKQVHAEMMKVLPAREGGQWLVGANLQMRYLKK